MAFSHSAQASSKLAVIYLARSNEGSASFQQFITSYKAFPAHMEHDLVIIFKGFKERVELEEARRVFKEFTIISIELGDAGFDIGSYVEAALRLPHEYICCLNTFSKILSEGWLKKFYNQIIIPGVGLVGATGSYESTRDMMTFIQKAIWVESQPEINKNIKDGLSRYFKFVFQNNSSPISRFKIKNRISSFFKEVFYLLKIKDSYFLKARYVKWWDSVSKTGDLVKFCSFPSFPNPHIRSNAFMINRLHFLSLKKPPFEEKLDACTFENGYESMTTQVINAGLKAKIVGKNGKGYDLEEWPHSNTFRSEHQENLLIADNQTNLFLRADKETRFIHQLLTWGKNKVVIPADFVKIGKILEDLSE